MNQIFYRNYSLLDAILIVLQDSRKKIVAEKKVASQKASVIEKIFRVNHSGELCAQGLYIGQAVKAPTWLKQILYQAAEEEEKHLSICIEQLALINGRISYLAPIWGVSSVLIGWLVSLGEAKYNLGFIHETERQVVEHLLEQLKELPANNHQQHEILLQMIKDEAMHAHNALENGANPLPEFFKRLMRISSKVMTISAKYI